LGNHIIDNDFKSCIFVELGGLWKKKVYRDRAKAFRCPWTGTALAFPRAVFSCRRHIDKKATLSVIREHLPEAPSHNRVQKVIGEVEGLYGRGMAYNWNRSRTANSVRRFLAPFCVKF